MGNSACSQAPSKSVQKLSDADVGKEPLAIESQGCCGRCVKEQVAVLDKQPPEDAVEVADTGGTSGEEPGTPAEVRREMSNVMTTIDSNVSSQAVAPASDPSGTSMDVARLPSKSQTSFESPEVIEEEEESSMALVAESQATALDSQPEQDLVEGQAPRKLSLQRAPTKELMKAIDRGCKPVDESPFRVCSLTQVSTFLEEAMTMGRPCTFFGPDDKPQRIAAKYVIDAGMEHLVFHRAESEPVGTPSEPLLRVPLAGIQSVSVLTEEVQQEFPACVVESVVDKERQRLLMVRYQESSGDGDTMTLMACLLEETELDRDDVLDALRMLSTTACMFATAKPQDDGKEDGAGADGIDAVDEPDEN
mmetsp:Transcript_38266/g.101211  ORF Transcript_38266/g.101211 Transcript_38266/m.101211 type:complete len:363 (+) Transcript_38266:89-1177(+)